MTLIALISAESGNEIYRKGRNGRNGRKAHHGGTETRRKPKAKTFGLRCERWKRHGLKAERRVHGESHAKDSVLLSSVSPQGAQTGGAKNPKKLKVNS
jgi:hypothetical protein